MLFLKHLNSSLVRKILLSFSSFTEFSEDKTSELGRKAFRGNSIFSSPIAEARERAKVEIENVNQKEYKIVTILDDEYPVLLKEIAIPPVLLFVAGQLQDKDSYSISMVGTRDCTKYGIKQTNEFVNIFIKNGLIISSGMALGIDTVAHQAAIKNDGITYGVIGGGLNYIFSGNKQGLANQIVDSGGAIISEYPVDSTPQLGYFPMRNRIISGISKATIVIESDIKGGSLITAKFAFNEGRELYAVPGNLNNPKSIGCNLLIRRNMASIATSPEEILFDLGFGQIEINSNKQSKPSVLLSEVQKKIMNYISQHPIHVDELSIKTSLDISELLVALLELEFKDIVKTMPGNYYIKTN